VNDSETKPQPQPTGWLIIGYGNTLRGDDGVGPRVAEAVDALRWPGVSTLLCQQLSPEHAEPISQAGRVVFVDASVEAFDEVELRELAPGETTQLMAHAADPRTLLALARDVFGHAPKAWWLTIPAKELGFSEQLSPVTQLGLERAIELVRQLVSESASAP
jgi:hydrogenase maturation protease